MKTQSYRLRLKGRMRATDGQAVTPRSIDEAQIYDLVLEDAEVTALAGMQ